MLELVRHALAEEIAAALAAMDVADVPVTLEVPPRRELGDLAWAGALPLARALRRSPRAIAEEVLESVGAAIATAGADSALALVEPAAAVEGAGFLNFRLRRGAFLSRLLLSGAPAPGARGAAPGPSKVIVEHTNINPNKAAHIGHLRNAVLGDVLVRCLRSLGHEVEVQNYVDDTGVQVADVVVGFLYLPEEELLAAIEASGPATGWAPPLQGAKSRVDVLRSLGEKARNDTLVAEDIDEPDFDDLCWELYPRVTRRYEEDEAFAARRTEVLHAVEGGFPPSLTLDDALDTLIAATSSPERPLEVLPDPGPRTPDPGRQARGSAAVARLAAEIAKTNLRCHLRTMGRLGVAYDVLPHESDILQRGFWRRAFELLQAAGAIRKETEGKNAGCWVMSLASSPEFAGMEDADKILVRSNGTVTYTGKDIAYQLWKLGLLRDPDGTVHDFGYAPFEHWSRSGPAAPVRYRGGPHALYRTAADEHKRPAGRVFGRGGRVYNVIDVRQSYPQKVVKEAIRILGHEEAADSSIHFAYEMVALTPQAVRRLEEAQRLDFDLSAADMEKPFIEMSGRRGIGVKADALLSTLVAEAHAAIAARQTDTGAARTADAASRAEQIAVGALRYQMARQGRNRVLAFDFEEALAFEGDTGPYLQYSAVRAAKIFEKLAAAGLAASLEEDARAVAQAAIGDDLWDLVLACARTPEMTAKAVTSLEFSLVAGHARDTAQAFHRLYHEHPVLHASDEPTRTVRRAVFRVFSRTIEEILTRLLGIPVPEEM
jgi:arginyl-tRNA synthetase